eukprot:1398331-Rhodomonas_salina.1
MNSPPLSLSAGRTADDGKATLASVFVQNAFICAQMPVSATHSLRMAGWAQALATHCKDACQPGARGCMPDRRDLRRRT